MMEALRDRQLDAELWCEEKSVWARAGLLLYLFYAGVNHLLEPLYRSWFAGITLAFHEMGHILFSGLGNTMMLLGGSIMQVVIPLTAAIYLLLRQGDYFGLAVGTSWLSFALWELAVYIYDAPREDLPLVGFGDHPQHDWGTLLTQWGVLNSSDTYASLVRVLATLVWVASMAFGTWLCWRIWTSARKPAALG